MGTNDFLIVDGVLEKYNGSDADVVVPDGVTTIGPSAFARCRDLTSITLPEGSAEISEYAFSNCINLQNIVLPKSITKIGYNAFNNCANLSDITLPEGIIEIGPWAFYGCTTLTSITLPENVTEIHQCAFKGCTSLASIILPEGITRIDWVAFEDCTSLLNIVLPESITEIGAFAFSRCESLTCISILNSNYKINEKIFGDKMPKSLIPCVKTLYSYFSDDMLKQYVLDASVWPNLAPEVQAEIFFARRGNLASAYDTCVTDPDTLGTTLLSHLAGKASAKECAEAANFMCIFSQKLSRKLLQQLLDALKNQKAATKALKIIAAGFLIINGVLEKYNGSDADVVVPDGVTAIGSGAFKNCTGLSSITLPEGSAEIGKSAFSNCINLQNIVLPKSITKIGYDAFNNCANLSDITLPEGIIEIGSSAFHDCTNLTSIMLPETITEIGSGTFNGCTSLPNIVLPESITEIGQYAFEGCTNLTSITLPENVTEIDQYAFKSCIKLASITLPEHITKIGTHAFENCTGLSSIVLPKSLTEIDLCTFENCTSLASIILPEGITRIDWGAFEGCTSLSTIVLPESITEIGTIAFSGCESLTCISILNSNCKIDEKIFGDKMPKSLIPCVKTLYSHFSDNMLKQYVLDASVWPDLAPDVQAKIFIARRGKTLVSAYDTCVTDPDTLGTALLSHLSGKASAKECTAAANFMCIFSQKVSRELLQQILDALKNQKAATKALKTIAADVTLQTRLNQDAQAEPLSELEQTAMRILQEAEKSALSLAASVKQIYGLELSALPKLFYRDGTTASELVSAYLFTAHEKMPDKSRNAPISYMAAAYEKPGICAHAAEILSYLDQNSFQETLLTLADENLGISGYNRKMFLAYPICRYADEALMTELTKRAPKWSSSVSGKDAPPLYTFRLAARFSETRAALFFADKFNDLEMYAAIRGTDVDTIRDKYLSDVGLDDKGGKAYDLGSQIATARLQKDLSFLVELPNGKTAKSLPKKGADAEKYAAANADFSGMKKSAKKIVKSRANTLFADFLSGRERTAETWKECYLNNPLLRQIGSLLVWTQDGNTFLLTDEGTITSDGTPYSIGEAKIALAHPMEMQKDDLTAWQKYFTANGIKQPFEQIWEPVAVPNTIQPDRYENCEVPFYRFSGQEKHGIHVDDEDFHSIITISFDHCDADVVRIDWEYHEIYMDDRFMVKDFHIRKFTRRSNHIVAYLDRLTVYDRIRKGDTSIASLLPQFSLAQITDFLNIATKNNYTNMIALLLVYKNQHFSDFDPMAEFSLDL